MERCPVEKQDSENLREDDIKESVAFKQRKLQNSAGEVALVGSAEPEGAMETPQLSDISSFNPDDPQVRQIDLDSSSLSG